MAIIEKPTLNNGVDKPASASSESREYVPGFASGVTGGPSGTIADGGAPGNLLITLPASGHSDPSDGCFIAFPLYTDVGKPFPDLPSLTTGTESRYGFMPQGWACIDLETSRPASGTGVNVGVAVVAAPTAADAVSNNAHGYGAQLDWDGAATGIRASLVRSVGWFIASAENNSNIDSAWVCGDMLNNALACGYDKSTNRIYGSRYVGNETLIAGSNSNDPIWLVVYAYRTGASVGSVNVGVSVSAKIVDNGEAP